MDEELAALRARVEGLERRAQHTAEMYEAYRPRGERAFDLGEIVGIQQGWLPEVAHQTKRLGERLDQLESELFGGGFAPVDIRIEAVERFSRHMWAVVALSILKDYEANWRAWLPSAQRQRDSLDQSEKDDRETRIDQLAAEHMVQTLEDIDLEFEIREDREGLERKIRGCLLSGWKVVSFVAKVWFVLAVLFHLSDHS